MKKEIRILISILRFEPGTTLGSEAYLSSFFEALSGVINDEQIAITASPKGCEWGKNYIRNVTWIPQVLPSSIIGRAFLERKKIENLAEEFKADVAFFPLNIMPPIKIPGVLLLHDLVNEFYCKRFPRFRPAYYRIVRQLVRNSIKRSSSIITTSHTIAVELKKLNLLSSNQNIFVSPLAVKKYSQKPARPEKLPVDNLTIILQSGAQLPHKNHKTGIDAMAELYKNHPEIFNQVRLVLTGATENGKKLESIIENPEIKKNISFLGRVSAEEIEWLLQKADIFCFPTLYEGFGLGLVDAQYRGKPVIASDIPILKEVSGECAVFFEPENEIDLAKKIKLLIEDREFKNRLVMSGRENTKNSSWQEHVKKVLQILKQTAQI